MKLHYFICDCQLAVGAKISLNTEIVHQVRDVLKIKSGERIVVSDGRGTAGLAEVAIIGKNITAEIIKILPPKDANRRVCLYTAILKRENFELLVKKSVEVGVDVIVPLLTERTVKVGLNFARLKKIVKEAVELSERYSLPEIFEPMKFEQALNTAQGEKLFFDQSGVKSENFKLTTNSVSIFIGPEGGWSEQEAIKAKEAGARSVSLGENILRGETAGIVAVYLSKWIF